MMTDDEQGGNKMPEPNQLRIKCKGGKLTEVLVTNEDGKVKNVTSALRSCTGITTPHECSNEFIAQKNGTSTTIRYVALLKQLDYTLEPETAKQIYALGD